MSQLAYVETFLRQLLMRIHEGATYHTLARELVGSLLIEQACAGAVVERLTWSVVGSGRIGDAKTFLAEPKVPIAPVGPFGWLAEAVGEQLLLGRCGVCSGDPSCGSSLGCSAEPFRDPPFAAVRSELLIGGKLWFEWLLVSAPCAECGGDGCSNGAIRIPGGCEACGGLKTRTDVKAIADRYQPDRPWRDEDTARVARFRVRCQR